MSAQRARSAVEASHRSIHPNVPGAPWYAALLLAVTATAIGYGIDSGHKELTHVFAGFYIAGCVAAVLAVRQDGVFTAIIQPPLILFCAVPGAYWMFHGRKIGNVKDLLINCGYPLIERFPLMLGTAGAVLLIGLLRWFFGKSQHAAVATDSTDEAAAKGTSAAQSFVGAIGAKLNSLLGLTSDDGDPSRTRRSPKAGSRTDRTARDARSAARANRTHPRRARPAREDEREPTDADGDYPRRRRQAPPRDFDPADPPPRPRRRPRPPGDPDLRAQPPRESRREPRTHRNPYDRPYDEPTPRGGRYDAPYEPRRRRAAPGGNGTGTTHHPISQVRYRGSNPLDELGAEPRSRSRAPRGFPAESWEYEG